MRLAALALLLLAVPAQADELADYVTAVLHGHQTTMPIAGKPTTLSWIKATRLHGDVYAIIVRVSR